MADKNQLPEKSILAIKIKFDVLLTDQVEKFQNDTALYFRLRSFDKRFVTSEAYMPCVYENNLVKQAYFRMNVFRLFYSLFHIDTIGKFFDLSMTGTLSGVIKSVNYFINEDKKNVTLPIKPIMLDFIINEIIAYTNPSNVNEQWSIIKDKIIDNFDKIDFISTFTPKEREEPLPTSTKHLDGVTRARGIYSITIH